MTGRGLLFREWFVVSFFMSSLGMILFSSYNSHKCARKCVENRMKIYEKKVLVSVEGAVRNPGQYTIEAGTSVQEVIKLAKPSKMADKGALPLRRVILNSCQIYVPNKNETDSEPYASESKINS